MINKKRQWWMDREPAGRRLSQGHSPTRTATTANWTAPNGKSGGGQGIGLLSGYRGPSFSKRRRAAVRRDGGPHWTGVQSRGTTGPGRVGYWLAGARQRAQPARHTSDVSVLRPQAPANGDAGEGPLTGVVLGWAGLRVGWDGMIVEPSAQRRATCCRLRRCLDAMAGRGGGGAWRRCVDVGDGDAALRPCDRRGQRSFPSPEAGCEYIQYCLSRVSPPVSSFSLFLVLFLIGFFLFFLVSIVSLSVSSCERAVCPEGK